jgi:hypothetical protein
VIGPFYPLFRRLLPRYVTTTVNIGRAMIQVAATGYSKQILSSADINQLSARWISRHLRVDCDLHRASIGV